MNTNNEENIRFAYWVPNVSGGLVVSKIEQRTSWDIDYNRKLAQLAERNGFDYALSQIRFTAGYGAEFQHEPVLFSHALLAATERLKLIVALLPGPWNPAVAAKQIATLDQLTGGRTAVNVVSGWFRGEFLAIGEPWLALNAWIWLAIISLPVPVSPRMSAFAPLGAIKRMRSSSAREQGSSNTSTLARIGAAVRRSLSSVNTGFFNSGGSGFSIDPGNATDAIPCGRASCFTGG